MKEFKEHIAPSVGIPVDKQRLIYQGRVLQEILTLADYSKSTGSVHFVLLCRSIFIYYFPSYWKQFRIHLDILWCLETSWSQPTIMYVQINHMSLLFTQMWMARWYIWWSVRPLHPPSLAQGPEALQPTADPPLPPKDRHKGLHMIAMLIATWC